ncbi:mucin-2-like [Topomyia yanbarensis]|uniref:mucin-2-like n=1 Tax=Topomyia yanbarensis TaxID=2498891 RepID=UPI00273ACE81|nr:mucin-2-like [Topomyia yanbarensis]
MRRRVDLNLIIRIWLVLISIKNSQSENAEPRALELSVPWRPLPYHVPQQQLISVASFDTTSKDELVHIAQHNAQILKHFNQPITQYQNQNTFQVQSASQQHHQLQRGHTPGPKYMTTPLLLTNVSPAIHTTARHSSSYGKSDQITTLNIVHPSTPKISHLAPVGVKSGKFNAQFREPVHNSPPGIQQKSTMQPHPVMNKLQTHMAVAYRQKQPVPATSNRLEHFVMPNQLYGTYIQFGQASSPMHTAKTKFISQLASHPSFDAHLKGLLHAGVGAGYPQTFSHMKNLHKMNYLQQPNKLQPFYNHISSDADLPMKLLSSGEKESSYNPTTTPSPLFPHIPPSVLTPFFQQVQQQQQQNKYSFNLKTQHPAPPAASPTPTTHTFKEKPHKIQHPHFQFETHQVHPTQFGSFKEHHGGETFGFTSYQSHQQPPIDHQPHEVAKFKEIKHHNGFNEIHDEYSKNLVPPPPSTQQAFLPTIQNHPDPSKDPIEILNKYNINPHSPLQDANRFAYESFAKPGSSSHTHTSTPSSIPTTTSSSFHFPSTTTPRQPFYSHSITFGGEHKNYNSPVLVTPINDNWIGRDKFTTTEKPNIFKNLFRSTESEYKQHKLMHPGYTGLPPNKRPSTTTPGTVSDASTEEPLITHSFFTIEDAISDPTLIPPGSRNKYKYTTEAEENRLDEANPEIVTFGPYLESQEQGTTTIYPMFKSKGRRRRPKPQQSTEVSAETDSTESPNKTRLRARTRPTTEAENETKTTQSPPTTTFLAEESSIRKQRKKLPTNFTRNRFSPSGNRDESDQDRPNGDQHEVFTQAPPVITTAPNSFFIFNGNDNNQFSFGGNGFRSRFRPGNGDRATSAEPKPIRQKTKLSDELDELFKSDEFTRDNESTRLNFKLPNTKPSQRPPSVSFGFSTTTTSASINSDESSAEINRTRAELNRPRFSIKEYRSKLNRSSTTTVATSFGTPDLELTTQAATKLRFPTRNRFLMNSRPNKTIDSNEVLLLSSSTTEKSTAVNETTTTRTSFRPTGTRSYNRFTVKKATTDIPQQMPSSTTSRIINRGRIRQQDSTTQSSLNRTAIPSSLNTNTLANRRPTKISLRQRIQNFNRKKEPDSTQKDSEQDNNSLLASSDETKVPIDDLSSLGTVDTQQRYEDSVPASSSSTTTTEVYRLPETAIMKIFPKDSSSNSFSDGDWDLNSASSDYSKRVVELTLSASKEKGFKSVNKGLLSRRVPGYFTLATEDPILPIEAFFPQVKKVSA